MPRIKKVPTLEEKLNDMFRRDHYISMITIGECDMGDHIDVTCSCGYENKTYGSTYDIVHHVIEVIAKELTIESSTV